MSGGTFKVGGIRLDLLLGLADFEKGLSKAEKDLLRASKKMKDGFNTGINGIGVGIGAIGTAALGVAQTFDAAYDQIRIATGKTGAELESLSASFLKVFSSVPVSAADASKAISLLNQRLGLTGEPLEQLATQTLNLARVTGNDLGAVLNSNIKLMRDWKIKVEDAGGAQDTLFKVSQSTGVELGALSSTLTSNGNLVRSLGLSFEEAAALVGKLEEEGAATDTVFAGLKKSLSLFGKEGIDFKQGFQDALVVIKDAPSDVDAAGKAIKIFGAKAGPELAAAIREGKLEFRSFLEEIKDSKETIGKVTVDTDGLEEQLILIKNKLAVPLKDIGLTLLEKSKPLLDEFILWLDDLGQRMDALEPEDIKFFFELAESLTALVLATKGTKIVIGTIGTLTGYIKALVALEPAVLALWKALTPWTKVSLAIGAVGLAVSALSKQVTKAREEISKESQLINQIVSKNLKAEIKIKPIGDTSNLLPQATNGSALADLTVGLAKLDKTKHFADIVSDLSKMGGSFMFVANTAKPATEGVREYGNSLDGILSKSSEAKDAINSLSEALREQQNTLLKDSLTDQLSNIKSSADSGLAESLLGQLNQVTREGILAGYEEAVAAGGPEAQKLANQIADAEAQAVIAKWRGDIKKNIAEAEADAHKEAVDQWQNYIEGVLSGDLDVKEFGKDLLVGFGAELAASVSDGLNKGVTDAKGIGAYLANLIFESVIKATESASSYSAATSGGSSGGSAAGGFMDLIGSYFSGGGSSTASGSSSQDFIGPAMSNGAYTSNTGAGSDFVGPAMSNGQHVSNTGGTSGSWAGYGAAAITVGTAAYNSSDKDKENQDNTGTAGAIGATIGAVIGAYFGPAGSALGATIGQAAGEKIGKYLPWGSTHPETLARKEIVQYFEKMLIELKGLKYFNSQGELHSVTDLYIGRPERFNTPGWADTAREQYGDTTLNAFGGISTAIGQLLGLKENVGDQVGVLLTEQFDGDIEALKALVDMVGLTKEKFDEMMLGIGKKGEESWLKVVSQIRDANAAFEEGIVGQAKYAQAGENFFKSQGKGQLALNQLVNMAVEGQEAGMKTIDQLMAGLVASGKFSAEEIKALQTALAENGISTLDQLRNANDMTLAFITAAADASLQNQGSGWRDVEEKLDDIKEQVDNLGESFGEKLTLNMEIKTHLDENTKKAMEADLFTAAGTDISTIRETSGSSTESEPVKTTAFAKGGIVMGATHFDYAGGVGLFGEADPEVILPLSRKGGVLGINSYGMSMGMGESSRPVQIIINAPNAAPGMEAAILEAFSSIEEAAVQRSVEIVSRML